MVAVVQPEMVNDKLQYRLSLASKDGVPSYSPELPDPSSHFAPDQIFRELLLTKLVNGERAAYRSASFANKIARTRYSMLKDIEDRFAD